MYAAMRTAHSDLADVPYEVPYPTLLPTLPPKHPSQRYAWAMEVVSSRAFSGVVSSDSSALLGSAALFLAAVVAFQTTHSETASALLASAAVAAALFTQLRPPAPSVALLPIVDSCNHLSVAPAALALDPASGTFAVRAVRGLAEQEQLTLSYGPRHNDDLLQYFGFVERGNPFDRCVLLRPVETLRGLPLPPDLVQSLAASNDAEFKDAALVVTRGAPSDWTLGSLARLGAAGDERVRTALALLMAQARTQLLSRAQDNPSELVRIFLAEKADVLEQALRKL